MASDPELLAPVADAFAQVRGALTRVLSQAFDAGELPASLCPERVAALMSATIQGGYVLAIAAQDPALFHDACQGVLELLDVASSFRRRLARLRRRRLLKERMGRRLAGSARQAAAHRGGCPSSGARRRECRGSSDPR